MLRTAKQIQNTLNERSLSLSICLSVSVCLLEWDMQCVYNIYIYFFSLFFLNDIHNRESRENRTDLRLKSKKVFAKKQKTFLKRYDCLCVLFYFFCLLQVTERSLFLKIDANWNSKYEIIRLEQHKMFVVMVETMQAVKQSSRCSFARTTIRGQFAIQRCFQYRFGIRLRLATEKARKVAIRILNEK